MKPSSPALRALITTRQFFVVDIFSFAFVGGGVARYCAGDQDVTYNGVLYPAGGQTGPFFDRKDNKSKLRQVIGTAVDSISFDVIPGAATIFGAPFLQAVHQGQFDNAEVTIERLFMPLSSYGDTSRGAVRMFVGRVAEVDAGRSVATFVVNDHRETLNIAMPRNLVQPGCVNNLGDTACGVNLASFTTTGTIASATAGVITANITNALVGYFDQGVIAMTSGALNGLSRSVKMATFGAPGTITLLGPFFTAPAPGDTFTISAGCNKSDTDANGCPKFYPTTVDAHFRGEPYVPQPVVAV